MSVNYSDGLSPYEHKGPCGQPELQDTEEEVERKINELVELIKWSKNMMVITGAGISTSAGIPDFRGPKGVWTLEKKGIKPEFSVTFEAAKPTPTHMALVALEKAGVLQYVATQNVDGLHLRSGFPRNRLSELHGDMFVEECDKCKTQYINSTVVPTMALQPTGNPCTQKKSRGLCRGKLRDTILDWEDALPDEDLDRANTYAKKADLSLCLGTSLQILPCGNLPLAAKRNGGNFVTINLQATKHEKKTNLKIHEKVDKVMIEVCKRLNIEIPTYEKPAIVLKSMHTEKSETKLNVVVRKDLSVKTENLIKEESLGDSAHKYTDALSIESSHVNSIKSEEDIKVDSVDIKDELTGNDLTSCLKCEGETEGYKDGSEMSVSSSGHANIVLQKKTYADKINLDYMSDISKLEDESKSNIKHTSTSVSDIIRIVNHDVIGQCSPDYKISNKVPQPISQNLSNQSVFCVNDTYSEFDDVIPSKIKKT